MDRLLLDKSSHLRARAATGRSQEGSAYIVTLMVLFVLTILGLSLTSVTQTESLVGSRDRQIERLFYAADAGVGLATSRVLVDNDRRAQTFTMAETRSFQGTDVFDVVDTVQTSRFIPILHSHCNLCQINQGSGFLKINHALFVQATRRGVPTSGTPDEAVPLGRKDLSVMVEIQPWQLKADENAFFVANESEAVVFK